MSRKANISMLLLFPLDLIDVDYVKRKGVFEHAQNAQTRINLSIRTFAIIEK